jgi:transposase
LGRTALSQKELQRVGVMSRVKAGELKLTEAGELLGLSYRQTKRAWRRYGERGAKGLQHGNAGRRSNRAKPEKFRRQVLGLVRRHYGGGPGERFGPTLAAEQMEKDHGVRIDAETLRRWMLEEGLWSRCRKRKRYRQRRERKGHFGELVQMDGSFEAWLEERGQRGCLMDMVDDATRTTLAQLGEEETTWAAADSLWAWVEEHGIPQALYTDWKNVYLRLPTPKEQLRGEEPLTQFGPMCAKLGIRIMGAWSPQAKGRCERKHGVHQDRLIKLLRLRKIDSIEEANRYLKQEYLTDHNARFSQAPAEAADYHRPVPRGLDLRPVFCLEEERVVSQDWVVRYQNRLLQLEPEGKRYLAAGSRVTVQEWRDGSLHVVYRGQEVRWKPIESLPEKPRGVAPLPAPKPAGHKPRPDHPWRRYGTLGKPAPAQLLPGRTATAALWK